MKTTLTTLFIFSFSFAFSQDYKLRRDAYFTGANFSFAVTALCTYGAWVKDLPSGDQALHSSALQTRQELRTITIVSGSAALVCYTMAYLNHRKYKRTSLTFAPAPTGVYLAYHF